MKTFNTHKNFIIKKTVVFYATSLALMLIPISSIANDLPAGWEVYNQSVIDNLVDDSSNNVSIEDLDFKRSQLLKDGHQSPTLSSNSNPILTRFTWDTSNDNIISTTTSFIDNSVSASLLEDVENLYPVEDNHYVNTSYEIYSADAVSLTASSDKDAIAYGSSQIQVPHTLSTGTQGDDDYRAFSINTKALLEISADNLPSELDSNASAIVLKQADGQIIGNGSFTADNNLQIMLNSDVSVNDAQLSDNTIDFTSNDSAISVSIPRTPSMIESGFQMPVASENYHPSDPQLYLYSTAGGSLLAEGEFTDSSKTDITIKQYANDNEASLKSHLDDGKNIYLEFKKSNGMTSAQWIKNENITPSLTPETVTSLVDTVVGYKILATISDQYPHMYVVNKSQSNQLSSAILQAKLGKTANNDVAIAEYAPGYNKSNIAINNRHVDDGRYPNSASYGVTWGNGGGSNGFGSILLLSCSEETNYYNSSICNSTVYSYNIMERNYNYDVYETSVVSESSLVDMQQMALDITSNNANALIVPSLSLNNSILVGENAPLIYDMANGGYLLNTNPDDFANLSGQNNHLELGGTTIIETVHARKSLALYGKDALKSCQSTQAAVADALGLDPAEFARNLSTGLDIQGNTIAQENVVSQLSDMNQTITNCTTDIATRVNSGDEIATNACTISAGSKIDGAVYVHNQAQQGTKDNHVVWIKFKDDSEKIIANRLVLLIANVADNGNISFGVGQIACLTNAQNGSYSLSEGENNEIIGSIIGDGQSCAYANLETIKDNLGDYPFEDEGTDCE